MKFAIRNLSVYCHSNGTTLWHYKAEKNGLDEVSAPGFFTDAADMLSPGDAIMIAASDGGRFLLVRSTNPLVVEPFK